MVTIAVQSWRGAPPTPCTWPSSWRLVTFVAVLRNLPGCVGLGCVAGSMVSCIHAAMLVSAQRLIHCRIDTELWINALFSAWF